MFGLLQTRALPGVRPGSGPSRANRAVIYIDNSAGLQPLQRAFEFDVPDRPSIGNRTGGNAKTVSLYADSGGRRSIDPAIRRVDLHQEPMVRATARTH